MPAHMILVIEDDAAIAGLVVEVLREAGHRPMWARHIEEARALVAGDGVPAAVLADLMVAGSRAPAALVSEIASFCPGVPLAIMTGVPRRRRDALGVKHKRILEKPFELDDLLSAVRSMLGAP